MTQVEVPLYPKVSSIYNKIMQLAIAIFIIIVVMNLWLFSSQQSEHVLDKHTRQISEQYLSQLVSGVGILLAKDSVALQGYIDDIAQQKWVKDISYYDHTGQLILASSNQSTINDLYGVSLYKTDRSDKFIPFVHELRNGMELIGYLRLTVEKTALTGELEIQRTQQFDLFRLMMILAGVAGFLLTRGLNRFSRQGYRPK